MFRKILLFFISLETIVSAQNPIIELPNGKIKGWASATLAKTSFYMFHKIPYAAPPIGSLRFKAPQPPLNWDDTLDMTFLDVSCIQLQSNAGTDGEDCLFLNVYTPKVPDENNNVSLPVMIYIYGGSFYRGSSTVPLADLFMDNGVILVTFNYRLGPFGFLSTQDDVIPGNNGLKDQKQAIQWTYDNIHLFGGDLNKITVFGQSSGAASVAYQLLNRDLEGKIIGAILESGTFLGPWALQKNARDIAFNVGAILNSTFENNADSRSLLEFLQSVDAADLKAAADQYMVDNEPPWVDDASPGLTWAPVIEVRSPDAFLTRKMYGLLKAGNILKVPTIIGFNSEESLLYNPDPEAFQLILEAFDENLDLLIPDDVIEITDSEQRKILAVSIRDIYTNGRSFGNQSGAGIRYASDNSFSRPITKHAELFSSLVDTFFYQFSYDGGLGGISIHYDGAESVGQGEELQYIFCLSHGCTFTESDGLTSKRLIKLWTDFAKYQNPTPELSELLQNITWPKLSVEDGDFLYLDINENLEIKNHPKQESLQKWKDLYDSLDYNDFDTY